MNRKFLAILIAVMLVVLMLPGVASAKGNDGNLRVVANNGHHETPAELNKLQNMVDKANRDIDRAVEKAQSTPYDDVVELLAEVDAIVAEVQAYAAEIGYSVACDYVTYYIDGQYVEIDPLRIIPL